MLLDLGKSLSFIAGLLSLFPLLFSAFFVPGARWQDRLFLSLDKAAISACICIASGLLFYASRLQSPNSPRLKLHDFVFSTPPVRLYFWTLGGMIVLFVASWYLETYYVPLLGKNLPWS
jgi:hypothetical protein